MQTSGPTRRAMFALAALLAMSVGGCSQATKPASPAATADTKPAPPTPIDKQKAKLSGRAWDPQWDQLIEQALPPELLSSQVPRDVKRFCPRFYDMSDTDKRVFWAYFFQALAGAEADLNPRTRAHHTEPEVAKRDEVSGMSGRTEGLLQLAYADQKRYGCDFNWQADRTLRPNDSSRSILQPKNNLECGVKILTNQVITEHKPLLSRSSYWSTLQPGRPSYRVFAKQMTNPPAACALPTKTTKIAKSETTQTVQQDAASATPRR